MIRLSAVLVLTLLLPTAASAQSTGTVEGRVSDAGTGDPLPGATIQIVGSAQGSATDLEGRYRLTGVPTGAQIFRVSFVGYQSTDTTLTVPAGQTVELNVALSFGVFEGEEVIVTAQALGQVAAINQQLSSNTIVNVVSAERIQELPDQNAAESLARLPGIAVQRDAGEGSKVVVRGLSPRFNAITVNGERIPSTDGTDRSVDLSMLSPDQLSGIEVFKALTPDKDADAIGGTVNFVIGRAPDERRADVRFQTGYASQEEVFGLYRGSALFSDRLFNSRLGILVTGNVQRADRSSDELDASWELVQLPSDENPDGDFDPASLNLGRTLETRDRYGAGLTMDYEALGGFLKYNASFGQTDRDEVRRRKRYGLASGRTNYDIRERELTTQLFTNSLSGTHTAGRVQLDWRGSYSRSLQRSPFGTELRFRELAAFNADLVEDEGLERIPEGAKNNLAATFLDRSRYEKSRVLEADLTFQGDIQVPFQFGRQVTGFIKTGGKIRSKDRERDNTMFQTGAFDTRDIGLDNPDVFDLHTSGEPLIGNFIDSEQAFGNFLEGDYAFGPVLDDGVAFSFPEQYFEYHDIDLEREVDDYEGVETISAGYIMAEINLTPRIMLLPGVRYEHTRTRYSSFALGDGGFDDEGIFIGEIDRISSKRTYDDWLPMVHLRVKPLSWFDVRLAYTQTLARPDYFNIVPYERVNAFERIVTRGNPDLLHTKAQNYDLFLSFYGNRIGLFSVGLFYKELEDIDYIKEGVRQIDRDQPFFGYDFNEPVNAGETSTVRGFEVDWQANLTWLPGFLSGVVLNTNYTYIDSETFIPLVRIERTQTLPPQTVVVDTLREARIPGQPTHTGNVSLGYERGGFSGRLSLVVQDDITDTFGSTELADAFDDLYARWDLALSQRLRSGISLFLNLNNLTAETEEAFQGIGLPTSQVRYGWTADLGLRYRIR
ncbi:MAG: TonB-dependent receptor [Bacteroidota bacterium]